MDAYKSLKRNNNVLGDGDGENIFENNNSSQFKRIRFQDSNQVNNLNNSFNTNFSSQFCNDYSNISIIDTKLNAIYLLIKNIDKNIEENKNDIKEMKQEIGCLNEEIKNIKGVKKNIKNMNNTVEKIQQDISTLEDNINQKEMINEELIINNIKKLNLTVNNEEESNMNDYSSLYIN